MSDGPPLSAHHPAIKHLRRLWGRRRARREHGQYLVEGPKLVVEALADDVDIEVVYVDLAATELQARVGPAAAEAGVPVRAVAEGALAKIADVVTPQPVVAVARGGPLSLADADPEALRGLVIVLAGVSDPGNAGTLVRTAEATGVSGVVFVAGSVDPLGPKTVRAAAGSSWRAPIYEADDLEAALDILRARGFRSVGTVATQGVPYMEADLGGDVALVLGSEAHGISEETLETLDDVVTIPLAGRVESLNVAVAGSLLCFERTRVRN